MKLNVIQSEPVKKWTARIAVTICLMLVFLLIGKGKAGYHLDEISTFILSNHQYNSTKTIALKVEEGQVYSGQELWNDYLSVNGNSRFDYTNVWLNQIHDVHPPLYYVLIHTASSLFPDFSIKKIGFVVSIPLAIVVFWQLAWVIFHLTGKKKTSVALAAAFILSYAFVNSGLVFFRMYSLLAVWVGFLVMIFLKYRAEDRGTIGYYALLAVTLFCGMLTQYYYLIFAFLACLVYAVFVVIKKNWKKLILSVVTAGLSFVFAYLAFPAMLDHILNSSRGKEAFGAAGGFDLFHLWDFLSQINSELFGGLFAVLLAVIICVAIFVAAKKKAGDGPKNYIILIVPAGLYVVIVSQIAPYQVMRYVISCIGLVYAGLFCLLVNMADRISSKAHRIVLVLAAIILAAGYRFPPARLVPEERDYSAVIKEYSSLPCFVFYDHPNGYKTQANLAEMTCLDSITFLDINNWEERMDNLPKNTPVLLYIPEDREDVLSGAETSTGLSAGAPLFSYWYLSAYVLE